MQQKDEFIRHPVNIVSVVPVELNIKVNKQPDINQELPDIDWNISTGHGEYDSKNKTIVIGIKIETPDQNETSDELPLELKVELVAMFRVDEEMFPVQHIYDWANKNAPFILFPYLREHVFALTARVGFRPLLLPLVEVPTFKLGKKIPKKKRDEQKDKQNRQN